MKIQRRSISPVKTSAQSRSLVPPPLPQAKRLQQLIQKRDYSSLSRIVTPSLYRRGLNNHSTRELLRRIERYLFQQAQRLLRAREHKAAATLLRKIVRLNGEFRIRAESLMPKTPTKGVKLTFKKKTAARKVAKKKAAKKNGGGRHLPKKILATPGPQPRRGGRSHPDRPTTLSADKGEKRPEGWVSAKPPEPPAPPRERPSPPPGPAPTIPRVKGGAHGEPATEGTRRGGQVKKEQMALRRTPHMDLSPEAPFLPNTEFKVYISVDAKAPRPEEESEEVSIDAPAYQEEFRLDVTLVVSGHFELRDKSSKPMTIFRSREGTPLIFKVRCVKEFPADPNAAISALFRYEGHPSGRVTRYFRVEEGKLVHRLPAKDRSDAASDVQLPRPDLPPPKLAVVTGLAAYDLVISVVNTGENDLRHFRLMADAPALDKHLDVSWNLSDRTDQIVSGYMKGFVAEGLEPENRLAQLKGAGVQLFKATPPEFQKLFWEMIDAGKAPKTILVVSDDPYVPWELMVPRRLGQGAIETRAPLGVEFSVGRWIRGDYTSPPQEIPLQKTYVVAPSYVMQSKNLKYAPQETAFVCSTFKPSRSIDPADFDNIEAALLDKGITLLHFICHGAADATQQTVYLRDMVNNLSGSVVEGSDNFVNALYRDHTFVFLNACEVGRAAPALVGVNGLPATFLRLGASGVVAALWSVKDDLAHEVAEKFYTTVVQQPQTPFAEILRDIRAKAYAGEAEDTYAAYCFYGSPLARREL